METTDALFAQYAEGNDGKGLLFLPEKNRLFARGGGPDLGNFALHFAGSAQRRSACLPVCLRLADRAQPLPPVGHPQTPCGPVGPARGAGRRGCLSGRRRGREQRAARIAPARTGVHRFRLPQHSRGVLHPRREDCGHRAAAGAFRKARCGAGCSAHDGF